MLRRQLVERCQAAEAGPGRLTSSSSSLVVAEKTSSVGSPRCRRRGFLQQIGAALSRPRQRPAMIVLTDQEPQTRGFLDCSRGGRSRPGPGTSNRRYRSTSDVFMSTQLWAEPFSTYASSPAILPIAHAEEIDFPGRGLSLTSSASGNHGVVTDHGPSLRRRSRASCDDRRVAANPARRRVLFELLRSGKGEGVLEDDVVGHQCRNRCDIVAIECLIEADDDGPGVGGGDRRAHRLLLAQFLRQLTYAMQRLYRTGKRPHCR